MINFFVPPRPKPGPMPSEPERMPPTSPEPDRPRPEETEPDGPMPPPDLSD